MSLGILGGSFKGQKISSPNNLKTRPSSSKCRQALFNICQNKIEKAFFLDLFAGSGAMGLEALSRGAFFSVFIDNDKESIRCIKSNLNKFHLEKSSEVYFREAFEALKMLKTSFDIIYIDPPYKFYEIKDFVEKLLSLIFQGKLLKEEGVVFLEVPSKLHLDFQEEYFFIKRIKKYGSSSLIEIFLKKVKENLKDY